MTDKQAIREAFSLLCDYQSPSLTKAQKNEALGRCWEILSVAAKVEDESAGNRSNNWVYGKEKELV